MKSSIFDKRVTAPIPSSKPLDKPQSNQKPQQQQSPKQSITARVKQANHEKCDIHGNFKVAFDSSTNSLVCNTCLFLKTSQDASPQTPLFTALMTRSLKSRYNDAYSSYKQSLCQISDIDPLTVKSTLLSQTQHFFTTLRTQLKSVKSEFTTKIKTSESLKNLESLIDANSEYFSTDAGSQISAEKARFDKLIQKGRYAGLVKEQEFWRDMVRVCSDADEHMRNTVDRAEAMLEQVVQVKESAVDIVGKGTREIVDDMVDVDVREGSDEQFDVSEVQMAQSECSMFSVSGAGGSVYFSSQINMSEESEWGYGQKNRQFWGYASDGGKESAGMTERYHVGMAVLPNKKEFVIVGGSFDAEATQLSDRVELYADGKPVAQMKPICTARAKVGVCVGELKSEMAAQYKRSFVYTFGGIGQNGNPLKVAEKFNVKANIWQGLPNLNQARASASGTTLGDYLYVFGGSGDLNTIERLNLKLNIQRQQDNFEQIDVKLPIGCQDMGFVPMINPREMLLIGGFSSEKRNLNQILKFSAIPQQGEDESQSNFEFLIEELPSEGFKADFFSIKGSQIVNTQDEEITVFGAQYKHIFTGTNATFSKSQPIQ